MRKVNYDDVIDISVATVNKLVELGIVKDCSDTDDDTEFNSQYIIKQEVIKRLVKAGVYEHIHSDGGEVFE
jgi:hypothetical protein